MTAFFRLITLFFALYASADGAIVTSIKPLHSLTLNLCQDVCEVQLIVNQTSAHHFSLRPKDLATLKQAEKVYWVGPNVEGFLPRVLKAHNIAHLQLSDAPNLQLAQLGDDEDHHVWLDIPRMQRIANYIAEDLIQLYPHQLTQIRQNQRQLHDKLAQLDQQLSTKLQPLQAKGYGISHGAINYWVERYQLKQDLVLLKHDELRPSAKTLHRAESILKTENTQCLVYLIDQKPSIWRALNAQNAITQVQIDPQGLSQPAGPAHYFTTLLTLADALLACHN